LIEQNLKDVKVIFTRKTDVFVELEDRAKIANDNNADLFISIHCNAAGKPVMIKDKKTGKMRPKTFKNSKGKIIAVETANPEPFGSETYVMGLKNEEGKMKVAQRENSAMLLEDNYEKKYQGFDPNSEESYIIMSNYTSSYVIQSAGLALKIQEQYFKKAGRVDKGVHRQSIWVLWRTSMPSVLTEIGYLTNPNEEKFLGSEKGQNYLAACLFRAFRKYKDEQEGLKKTYNDAIENEVPLENENYKIASEKEEVKTIEKPEEKEDVEIKKDSKEDNKEKLAAELKAKIDSIAEAKLKQEKIIADQKAKALVEQKAKDDARKNAKSDSIAAANEQQSKINDHENKYMQLLAVADMNFKNKNYQEALGMYQKANELEVKDKSKSSQKIKDIDSILKKIEDDKIAKESLEKDKLAKETLSKVDKEESKEKTAVNVHGIVFKVQFASMDKEVDAKIKFSNLTDVTFYKAGAIFKYTSGSYASFDDATMQQVKMRELGYKDCFVAAFKNGARMDIGEARKIVETK
jgi:N-acetylmuramoyl-L-alanine amidase